MNLFSTEELDIDKKETLDYICAVNGMGVKVIAIVVVVVLLLGGGALLYTKAKPATYSSPAASPTPVANAKTQSLLDILGMGKTQKCTFSYDSTSGGKTDGVVYLSGDKMRGEFKVTSGGKVSDINMIRVGDTNYMWGTGLPGGIKMTISAKDFAGNAQASQYVDANTKTDYKCEGWVVDPTKFVAPPTIKFTDYSALMPKTSSSPAGSSGTSGYSAACGACNYLTGDSKATCLARYNCAPSK